ncbi:hypothetical protein [Paenibacillus sp. J45TS6]|uniref:hypothetical protein n=1 Tax=Paenibacillus sp. J45TS6 TaxID=2807196 RepID=UPI001BD15009|nr:hypothetical protein [Paenibacillus sp. J45TS6]
MLNLRPLITPVITVLMRSRQPAMCRVQLYHFYYLYKKAAPRKFRYAASKKRK